ncbi:SagB/ThcOx family dehydrogenase [Patescibacteria group bacterium]
MINPFLNNRGQSSAVIVLIVVVIVLIGVGALYLFTYDKEETNTNTTTTTANTATTNTTNANVAVEYTEIPKTYNSEITLPAPDTIGTVALETTLQNRRSRRTYAETPLTLANVSQLLWSAQGITNEEFGGRTAPSSHAVYPFNVYLVVENVEGLSDGVYHYIPQGHKLGMLLDETAVTQFREVQFQEDKAKTAPAVIVLAGIYDKMAVDSPDDPQTPVLEEAGHIGQNLYLQTEALGLGGVVMGGFPEAGVSSALGLPSDETVIYQFPVGNRAAEEASE